MYCRFCQLVLDSLENSYLYFKGFFSVLLLADFLFIHRHFCFLKELCTLPFLPTRNKNVAIVFMISYREKKVSYETDFSSGSQFSFSSLHPMK